MIVEFLNKDLEELYETGHSKKYKNIPQNIAKGKLHLVISLFMTANHIQDIWKNKGLHFEQLINSEKYSVRLDIRYRLEMKIDWTNSDCTVGIIGLTDLTKHYGD